jgi:hypothetical protein
MNQRPKFDPGSSSLESASPQAPPSVLTLATPLDEEIAQAIWLRQRDQLVSDALNKAKWRDPSVPAKFWNEFLLDARAVLSLLYGKHFEYQNGNKK